MTQTIPEREAVRYPRIIAFIRDTPWQILESKLAEITEFIELRASGVEFTEDEIAQRVGNGPATRGPMMHGSVAIVPIHGTITPRATLMGDISGGTSIDRLIQNVRSAANDPNVSAIVLDVNSPGGSVAMLNEAAQEIRDARRRKQVVAVANHMAASAAYRLASQAHELVVTPSGSVGSVGTIAAHDDISKLQEMAGVRTTLITAGKHKGELSPYAPLSDEARAHMQETVDKYQRMFEQDVARGRGIPVETVRSDFGQGRMMLAQDAVRAGMADRVATMEQVVADLQRRASAAPPQRQDADLLDAIEGPIKPHSTATTDAPWDGPRMKANLPNEDGEQAWIAAFAWFDSSAPDPNGDGYPDRKGDYKFIHHMVSDAGDVGAANVTACSDGIGVLNGGRTGTTIPAADRQGVYDHLARHLRDAGQEPPPLKSIEQMHDEAAMSGLSFAGRLLVLHEDASSALEEINTLADFRERGHLTGAKRERLAACTEALANVVESYREVLATAVSDKQPVSAEDGSIDAVGAYLARIAMEGLE